VKVPEDQHISDSCPASGARRGSSALIRDLVLSVAGRGVSMGANFVFVFVTARHFTRQEVAVIALAGILALLMDLIKGLGLSVCLLKQLPKLPKQGNAEAATLVLSFLFYSLLLPAIVTVAMVLIARPFCLYFLDTSSYAPAFRLGLWGALFTVWSNSNLNVLLAREEFSTVAMQTGVTSLAQKLFPVLAALWLAWDLETFLLWSAVFAAVAFVISLVPLRGLLTSVGGRILRPREFWPESRHYYYTSMVQNGATQLDQVLVAALFTPATLAVYSMLRRLYSMLVLLINSLLEILIPDISRQAGQAREVAQARMRQLWMLALFLGASSMALLAGNGEWLVDRILGSDYSGDPVLVTLFCVSAFAYLLFRLVQVDLLLFHEPRLLFRTAAVATLLNLLAVPALGWLLGVKGPPLAMILSHLVCLEFARRGSDSSYFRADRALLAAGLIAGAGILTLAGPALGAGIPAALLVNIPIVLILLAAAYKARDYLSVAFRGTT